MNTTSPPQTDDYKELVKEQIKSAKQMTVSVKELMNFHYGNIQTQVNAIEKNAAEMRKCIRDMEFRELTRYNECPNTKGLESLRIDVTGWFKPVERILANPKLYIGGMAVAILVLYAGAVKLWAELGSDQQTIKDNTARLNIVAPLPEDVIKQNKEAIYEKEIKSINK
jgi:hypothetical protein